ncbi:MAG TPA: ABC transporter ATP-binding protein [Ktedonosporobacter sp.]|nr:ABC transporter ATP-binding protein [Ktedonosporobacter sp.]
MKLYQLLGSLARYRLFYEVRSVIGALFANAATVAFGLWIQQLFNALSTKPHFTMDLWWLLILLFLATMVQLVTMLVGFDNTLKVHYPLRGLLIRNVLAHIFQQPAASALPMSPGEAMNSLRDDTETIAFSPGIGQIGQFIFVVVALIMLLRLNATITLLVFLPLACVIATARTMMKKVEQYRQASRNATGQVTGAIGEMLSAAQAIQVARAEAYVMAHFRQLSHHRLLQMLRERLLNDTVNALLGNIVGIGTGLILFLAALNVSSTHLSIGDIALFIYYMEFVAGFMAGLGTTLGAYVQTRVAFGRLFRLMPGNGMEQKLVEHHPIPTQKTLVPVPETEWETAYDPLECITATALTYHHPETGRGIDGIDLRLQHGSLTAIVGRIGSGKTTLLRTLLGLLAMERGEIRWNGKIIETPATFFVPPHAAYTPQVPHLFSDTLQENILLGKSHASVDMQRAIYQAVLDKDVARFPEGTQTEIGTRGMKLSGGQVQRTAAARMLACKADLLVMDDLSSALDVETERILWARLFARREQTCLVVSHRREVLSRADHIIVLKGGKVEAEGPLDQLLATCEEMQRLWHGHLAGDGPGDSASPDGATMI